MNTVLCVTLSVTVAERSAAIFKVSRHSPTLNLFLPGEVYNHEKNLASRFPQRG
jgi:hypothetical protein